MPQIYSVTFSTTHLRRLSPTLNHVPMKIKLFGSEISQQPLYGLISFRETSVTSNNGIVEWQHIIHKDFFLCNNNWEGLIGRCGLHIRTHGYGLNPFKWNIFSCGTSFYLKDKEVCHFAQDFLQQWKFQLTVAYLKIIDLLPWDGSLNEKSI